MCGQAAATLDRGRDKNMSSEDGRTIFGEAEVEAFMEP